MYKISTLTEPEQMMVSQPLGPGLSPNQIEEHGIDKIEVWGSSFKDPGPDFVEYRLFAKGKIVNKIKVGGY